MDHIEGTYQEPITEQSLIELINGALAFVESDNTDRVTDYTTLNWLITGHWLRFFSLTNTSICKHDRSYIHGMSDNPTGLVHPLNIAWYVQTEWHESKASSKQAATEGNCIRQGKRNKQASPFNCNWCPQHLHKTLCAAAHKIRSFELRSESFVKKVPHKNKAPAAKATRPTLLMAS